MKNGGRNIGEKNMRQRRLTVRECARIQTFPDNYQFVLKDVSASEGYKLIGNDIPPLLGYHIAQKIIEVLDIIEHDRLKSLNFCKKVEATNCLNAIAENDSMMLRRREAL